MHVDIADGGLGKKPCDHGFDGRAVHHVGVQHHAVGVVAAQRQQPHAQRLGHLVDGVVRLGGALAYKNGVRGAVGRVRILADMVQQQHRIADRRVAQFDAIRVARLAVDDVAQDAERGQLGIGQAIQVLEWARRQAADTERHGQAPAGSKRHQTMARAGLPSVSCSRHDGIRSIVDLP